MKPKGNALAVTFLPSTDAASTEGRFLACSGGWDWVSSIHLSPRNSI
jgi:hypothetical protein